MTKICQLGSNIFKTLCPLRLCGENPTIYLSRDYIFDIDHSPLLKMFRFGELCGYTW